MTSWQRRLDISFQAVEPRRRTFNSGEAVFHDNVVHRLFEFQSC
jgi:hypothetical protein